MKFKILFFLIIFSNKLYPQLNSKNIDNKRILIVAGSLTSATLGTYFYIQNAWWSADQVSFHFDLIFLN